MYDTQKYCNKYYTYMYIYMCIKLLERKSIWTSIQFSENCSLLLISQENKHFNFFVLRTLSSYFFSNDINFAIGWPFIPTFFSYYHFFRTGCAIAPSFIQRIQSLSFSNAPNALRNGGTRRWTRRSRLTALIDAYYPRTHVQRRDS